MGGLAWRELGARVWRQLSEDRILGRAAQLSFYFLLSLFPMLLILMALLARFAGAEAELRAGLLALLAPVAPASSARLVEEFLARVGRDLSGGGISFGILIALWASSSGMVALMNALNLAYEIEESRPWWKRRLVAVGFALALLALLAAALLGVVYGSQLAAAIGAGGAFALLWDLLKWPAALAFVLLVFNLLYLYAPNVRQRGWSWLMPGTAAAVALWLAACGGFKLYLEHFGAYSAVYGSLGAAIVLLLWFYLTGIAILIGAQVNSEIQRAGRNV